MGGGRVGGPDGDRRSGHGCGHGRSAGGSISEPSLAHRLFARMPAGSTLVVSSSMPVRDLEAFAPSRHEPPRVLANRGANGIDGVVSTALGVAVASSGPTVALVGDLAFFHDVSALVRAEGMTASLTVVVADNDGGGIFSFLDQAAAFDTHSFDLLFGTPQLPDVASVAAGFGWPVDECGPAAATGLEEALDRRLAGASMSVIRVGLPGADRERGRASADQRGGREPRRSGADGVRRTAPARPGQQGRGS